MAAEKARRTKPSKVDLLPEVIQKRLAEMLRDRTFSQGDILQAVNEMVLDAGLEAESTISRSGLSRHAQKVEGIGKHLRELRETTKALTSELGDKPTGDTTKLILEMGRSMLFKAMQQQMLNPEVDETVDINMIKEAMLAAQRLESTAMNAHKREKEIRKAFAEEAADAVEAAVVQAGLTKEGADLIKKQILGIV